MAVVEVYIGSVDDDAWRASEDFPLRFSPTTDKCEGAYSYRSFGPFFCVWHFHHFIRVGYLWICFESSCDWGAQLTRMFLALT